MIIRIFVTLVLVATFFAVVQACAPAEKVVCKFKKGEIVHSVLDNRKGQIIGAYQHCAYNVRFAGNRDTQASSWDVETLPYAKVYMQEIELKQ